MFSKILKYLYLVVAVYIIFALLTIIIIPRYNISKTKLNIPVDVNSFKSQSYTGDEATVISDLPKGLSTRVQLIRNAEESIDIAYYRIDNDLSGRLVFGELLDASERGVKVRILINNSLKYLNAKNRFIYEAMNSNENIELKFYGGFEFPKPWLVNEVLHDKMIVADGKYFMSSGRNVSDRFLVPMENGRNTYDYDFILRGGDTDETVVSQATKHFDELWDSEQSQFKVKYSDMSGETKEAAIADMKSQSQSSREQLSQLLVEDSISTLDFVPVNRASLVTNPLGSVVKEPRVWNTVTSLMNGATNSVTLQSPYVNLTKDMLVYLDTEHLDGIDFNVLTNSVGSSPNFPAYSNYLTKKASLLEYADVHEYQSPGSIHGKALIVDYDMAAIGSFNSDSRSTYFSSENMIIVNGVEFNQQLSDLMDGLLSSSLQASGQDEYYEKPELSPVKVSKIKKILFSVIGFFGRPFDFLV